MINSKTQLKLSSSIKHILLTVKPGGIAWSDDQATIVALKIVEYLNRDCTLRIAGISGPRHNEPVAVHVVTEVKS